MAALEGLSEIDEATACPSGAFGSGEVSLLRGRRGELPETGGVCPGTSGGGARSLGGACIRMPYTPYGLQIRFLRRVTPHSVEAPGALVRKRGRGIGLWDGVTPGDGATAAGRWALWPMPRSR